MVLSGKFNGEALEPSKSERGFNPFAANAHLTTANAAKLAALEQGAGSGLIDRVTTGEGVRGLYGERRGRKAETADEALLRLTLKAQQWDAQIVTVGGVTMTNAQAQAARRRILENPDYYTGWAKERGLINEGEERQFIETARRITDLKDRERSGRLGAPQKQEMESLQGSRLGRAVDQATGHAHNRWKLGKDTAMDRSPPAAEVATAPVEADALFEQMSGKSSERPPEARAISSVDDPVFAGAPSLKSGFAAGLNATEPLDRARTEPEADETPPRAPDRTAAASGLDL